jgi:hypothetical protein
VYLRGLTVTAAARTSSSTTSVCSRTDSAARRFGLGTVVGATLAVTALVSAT